MCAVNLSRKRSQLYHSSCRRFLLLTHVLGFALDLCNNNTSTVMYYYTCISIVTDRQMDSFLFTLHITCNLFIAIHIMYKLELALIVQSGIKTAHHTVC